MRKFIYLVIVLLLGACAKNGGNGVNQYQTTSASSVNPSVYNYNRASPQRAAQIRSAVSAQGAR
jgi:hypothetical protein